jgi:hypothetical protein
MVPKAQAGRGGNIPTGLIRLREVSQCLTESACNVERNLRILVTVPTLRLAGAVAALGSVLAEDACRGCAHQYLEAGARISAWASGRFVDATLSYIDDQEACFGGLRLRGKRDSMHRLPSGFPERADARFPDEIRADVAAGLACTLGIAGQRHSARCPHPVIVAGEPKAFRDDVEALAACDTRLHIRGRLDPGHGLTDWFRHPVLRVHAIPELSEAPWAAELRPRLLIVRGSVGWMASSRRLWPGVPILALISRRSPAGCEVAATIRAFGWPRAIALPPALSDLLRPGHGLEVSAYVEPEAAPHDEDLW